MASEKRVIEAEAFVVKDSQGRRRGFFGMQGEEPTLILYDEDATGRIVLRITAEHSGGTMSEIGDEEKVGLSLTAGSEGMALFGRNGKPHLIVLGMADGQSFYLYDPKGKVRLRADVRQSGSAFSLHDQSGGVRGIFGLDEEGPHVVLADEKGRTLATLDKSTTK